MTRGTVVRRLVRTGARAVAGAAAMALLASTIAATITPTTAGAGTADGKLGGTPPEIGIGLSVSTPGALGTGHDSYRASDPKAPRPVFERAVASDTGGDGASGLSNLCESGPPTTPPGLPNGWIFYIELFETATGRNLGTSGTMCVPFAPGAPGARPDPPVLPQPPTIGEIWAAAGLPDPTIGVSPAGHGITGLPTWVWTSGSAPVAIAVTLAGFRVTGTARVVGYGVYPGEGGWTRHAGAGGPGDPASMHTYESTGTYRLGVATLWSAAAVMTGPNLTAPLTIDLGTAVVTNGRDYPVTQVRSRLLP